MQCSQLILGRLVVATVAYRPWSFMNWRSLLCISDVCQQQRRYNQCRAKDCFARHGSLSFQCTLLRANGGGVLRATAWSASLFRDRFVAGVSPTRFCDRFWRLRRCTLKHRLAGQHRPTRTREMGSPQLSKNGSKEHCRRNARRSTQLTALSILSVR